MNKLKQARETLLTLYQTALARVSGREAVRRQLGGGGYDCSLIAIGKAAGAMAQGAIDQFGSHIIDGW